MVKFKVFTIISLWITDNNKIKLIWTKIYFSVNVSIWERYNNYFLKFSRVKFQKMTPQMHKLHTICNFSILNILHRFKKIPLISTHPTLLLESKIWKKKLKVTVHNKIPLFNFWTMIQCHSCKRKDFKVF